MNSSMAWATLMAAGLLEVCWAIGLKYSQGFTKPLPAIFTVVTLALSMILLSKASDAIPMGTAYAVWVGVGAFGTAVLGIVLFKESVSLPRLAFLCLLLVAIAGLKLTANR